ncbi:hypothetical protein OPV22_006743 [Ensete ventricosum]|uniref:UBA domain-containing protein n=1 Tax=Ensete ventricosum TaxID=4639 RepID=A0AAV8Q531_ENSVE|nr:hypothetical protein OPV22_006743 [Ensete ventricosum]
MSPATKSKSKDKLAAKAAKEQAKVSSKHSSALLNYGNGAPSNAYNPDSGTFHNFDTMPSGSLPTGQNNGHFRTIDETEEHSGSSSGTTGEFDSISNHNGYSGESEDQKEKNATSNAARIESVLGCDTDKRDKIRQKNEKKHQRQKERRAQELHERCSGYLMSRKLEMLSQKLVAMGFSSEQATMALIQNEGRVEESIMWLLERSEESKQQIAANIDTGANLKIDITTELTKISDMEVKFKCTKQEVERAVVACEGDLEKAEGTLKTQKQEPKIAPSKLEETGDPVAPSGLDFKMVIPIQNAALRPQHKVVLASVGGQQQRRDERDLNYIKTVATGVVDSPNKNMQSLRKIQPKPDWGKPQVVAPVEKRWSSASSTSISYSLPSSLQVAVPPTTRYVIPTNEPKANLPSIALREPVTVMQRPQSVTAKQNPASTSLSISASPPASAGFYSNGMSSMDMMKVANGGLGRSLPYLGLDGSSAQQFAPRNHFQTSASSVVESFPTGGSGSWNSAVDWSSGGSTPCDYTSIDWSLDSTLLRPSMRSDHLSATWSTMFMGGKVTRPVTNTSGGVCIAGLQDGGSLATDSSLYSSGSHDWSSPFAGKDLFSVPRQFVTNSPL